jgi:hypothetical protein
MGEMDKFLDGSNERFTRPGEAFQEVIERFGEMVSYLKSTSSIIDYKLEIFPDSNQKGVIEGYLINGMIKTEITEDDEEELKDYPTFKYSSIVKFYLAYTGKQLQKSEGGGQQNKSSFKKGSSRSAKEGGESALEEKVWVLSKWK